MVYEEGWMPFFGPMFVLLPVFTWYKIRVDDTELRFGYLTSAVSKRIPLSDIRPGSVCTGSSDWKYNLTHYGGWGIRGLMSTAVSAQLGFISKTVYNAANGPWVEVTEDSTGKIYRFATRNPDQVIAALGVDPATITAGIPVGIPVDDATFQAGKAGM